jgi:hypothetical protein
MNWIIPDAHPLQRWLLAHELADARPEAQRYDHMSAWWVFCLPPIYRAYNDDFRWVAFDSLPRFLSALAPALNARLAGAKHILGANYAAALHIAAPRAMGGGVVLRVADGAVFVTPAPDTAPHPSAYCCLLACKNDLPHTHKSKTSLSRAAR